jgi:hypothetical protein
MEIDLRMLIYIQCGAVGGRGYIRYCALFFPTSGLRLKATSILLETLSGYHSANIVFAGRATPLSALTNVRNG